MIFNMVGGGGGSGATLVVSSPANVSVTVSKDDKSYTKNSGSLGSTTFKGLATGTWAVVISGNGQTATKTIEITADYAITIAFFSASINITYPANSTCVVTNSSGQTVASDTNTGSSTKTWTATVNATGTYTVAATATDGSGKSKSQSVSITTDGQSESVTLNYSLMLYDAGDECTDVTGGWVADATGSSTGGWNLVEPTLTKNSDSMTVAMPTYEGNGCVHMTKSVDMSEYTTLKATISDFSGGSNTNGHDYISIYKQGANPFDGYAVYKEITKADTFSLAVDSLNEEYKVAFGCANNGITTQYTITKVWLE